MRVIKTSTTKNKQMATTKQQHERLYIYNSHDPTNRMLVKKS